MVKVTPKVSANQLALAGKRIYEQRLQEKLETRYTGKIVAIEVESGDYFIGDTLHEASQRAKKKYPDRVFYFMKVGYPAVYSFPSGATISTSTLKQ